MVVDASVALKWVLDEEGTEAALAVLEEDVLYAPDFLLLECANVLWTKVRRQVMTREQADAAYDAIAAVPWVTVPLAELIAPARALSYALDLTIYDCVYAALSARMHCALATADGKLARALESTGIGVPARLIR